MLFHLVTALTVIEITVYDYPFCMLKLVQADLILENLFALPNIAEYCLLHDKQSIKFYFKNFQGFGFIYILVYTVSVANIGF